MWNSQREARDAGYQNLYDTARTCMWERLGIRPGKQCGPDYGYVTEAEDYEKAKERLGMNNPYICPTAIINTAPMSCYDTVTGVYSKIFYGDYNNGPCFTTAQQEGTNNMMSASVNIANDDAKRYALSRVNEIFHDHDRKIESKYAEPRPATLGEMKKWLKDGNYRLDFGNYKDETSYAYYSLYDFLRWSKTGPDMEAKTKAGEELQEKLQEAKDIINISTDEDKRLKAIQDFESYTIH